MRSVRIGIFIGRAWLILAFLIAALAAPAKADTPALGYTKIEQAELSSLSGMRQVQLPHRLNSKDFDPEGGLVRYTLLLDLPTPIDTSLSIFVPKLALSGNVQVNGKFFASCGSGSLMNLRCLNRPYLFTPPPDFWKPGLNKITFEIYATGRQSNGLSAITVGNVDVLESVFYRLPHWLKVDLLMGLTWLSALLGLLALVASSFLKKDSVYFWFGTASIVNAATNVALLSTHPIVDMQWFNWFVFSSRFVSVPLMLMMFVAFFDKLSPKFRNTSLAYIVVSIGLIAISSNNKLMVAILYLPSILTGCVMLLWLAHLTWKSKQLKHTIAVVLMFVMAIAGVSDWLRLSSSSAFEGTYLISYAFSGVMVALGTVLMGLMAHALVEHQELRTQLESRVMDRTAELIKTHELLLTTEVERSKEQERTRLLQDMHDGFGHQLVIARMMSQKKIMSQSDLTNLLDECISDLYLVVDTISNNTKSLSDALVDLKFRTEKRLFGTAVEFHWKFQLEELPEISHKIILQILRILQEAMSNSLKHANAENICIVAVYIPNVELMISVSDDGRGMNEGARTGSGLNNMKTRARNMSAELVFCTREVGSEVTFRMPFDEKSRLALWASPRHTPPSNI